MKYIKGSSITQYAIIIGLVSVAATSGLIILGSNINNTYDKCTKELKGSIASNQVSNTSTSSNTTSSSLPNSSNNNYNLSEEFISDNNVVFNDDESITITSNNRDINLSPELIALNQKTLSTSGSSGLEEMIAEIGNLLVEYECEYHTNTAPISILYGGEMSVGSTTWTETVKLPTMYIKVGNKVSVLETKHGCTGNASDCTKSGYEFTKFEGDINNLNIEFLNSDYSFSL